MDCQAPIRIACTIFLFAVLIRDASLKSVGENDVNIVGGRYAKPNELPYQVALFFTYIEDIPWVICGGSIINKNFVLSAAHCFEYGKKESFIVRAGVIDYEKEHEDRRLESVKIHPKYSSFKSFFSFNHDIALLKVDKPFTFDKSVQPVPLVKEYPPQGTVCVVSGWGMHYDDRRKVEDNVNKLKLAEHKIGIQLFDNIYVTDYLTGSPFHIDKFSEGCYLNINHQITPASGDSGGPLVCDGYLTGVVQAGQPNSTEASGKKLVSYTNVMTYKQWLHEEGFDI